MRTLSLFWLAAAVLLFVAEGISINLVTVWFAVGCSAALIVSLFCGSFLVQFTVFIVVSILCLLCIRPLTRQLRSTPAAAVNGERNLGRVATVLTPIGPEQSGRVRLDGVDWAARSAAGQALQPGELCRVVNIESTVLIVQPDQPAPQPAAPQQQ